MSLYPVAGCHIYIGGVLADKSTDFVASDFNGQSWVEIDGWSQMGAHGDSAQVITTPLINRGRDIKQKGTNNAGSMQNVFAEIKTDAGQAALLAASLTKNSYAIRVDYNDPVTTTPTKHYFIALVMSAEAAGGAANTIRNLTSTFEINSNIVEVAAS